MKPLGMLIKRIIDLIISLILLMPTLIFVPVVGVLIKMDSHGPVFFRQQRYGKNNRPFVMYKFRTMIEDADKQQSALVEQNEATGFLFKITIDPRQTRMGRLLRNLGIDEVPQLFNVLKGEMSLVGPRPLPVSDVDFEKLKTTPDLYKKWEVRKKVKPGITGLWQMNPGDHLFDKMLDLDAEYVENFSLKLDVRLFIDTIQLALFGMFPKIISNPRNKLLKIKKENV